jgi:16S rRNA (guanine966-N2)-methyltransferase
MQVISGKFKGFKIPLAKDADYRPSTAKVKEAIFSILQSNNFIHDAYVLDLFCGTGALCFEAMSRGAKFATAIDSNKYYIANIKSFVEKYSITNIEAFAADVTKIRNLQSKYDLVFIDPPYDSKLIVPTLKLLDDKSLLLAGAIIIIELNKREDLPILEGYKQIDERLYGKTKILIWQYEKV